MISPRCARRDVALVGLIIVARSARRLLPPINRHFESGTDGDTFEFLLMPKLKPMTKRDVFRCAELAEVRSQR